MISAENYAKALHLAITETAAKDHDKVLDNFVKMLNENGDLGMYPQIEQQYEKIVSEQQGIKQVEISTARDVSLTKDLLELLNKHVAGKIEVKHKIDDKLIGGVVVRVDDTLIDASLQTTLKNLKRTIAK